MATKSRSDKGRPLVTQKKGAKSSGPVVDKSARAPASSAPTRPPIARAEKAAPSASARPARGPSLAHIAEVSPSLRVPTWRIGSQQDERRLYPRVQKDLPIRLFAGRGKDPALECTLRSEDMSLSGIFLRSTFFIAEDTPVRIELTAPWGQLASVRGIVARVVRSGSVTGFGIRFTDLDADALTDLVCIFVGDHIQQFVADFAKRQGSRVDVNAISEALLAWELARLRSLAP